MKNRVIILLVIAIMIIQTLIFTSKEVISIPGKKENQKASEEFFGDDITFKWEYYEEGKVMPHGIFIPSNAEEYEAVPLIVYLHGSGGQAEASLKKGSLPGAINKGKLENFCAYVLCPLLPGIDPSWTTSTSINKLIKLLENTIKKYNVDRENIIISGESRGGTGALALANTMSKFFSKCVAFSAFYRGPFNASIDTLCFYSWYADDASKNAGTWKAAFGEKHVFSIGASHGSVGYLTTLEDSGEFSGVGTGRK